MSKEATKPKRPRGWLKNPKLPRTNEVIEGGYWVFRRGDGTKRIRPAQWPFEYGTQEAAMKQAAVLAEGNPGERFIVVRELCECIEAHATPAPRDLMSGEIG
jgi:hypothetical protein